MRVTTSASWHTDGTRDSAAAWSRRSATASNSSPNRCPYRSRVIAALACPSIACTPLTLAPAAKLVATPRCAAALAGRGPGRRPRPPPGQSSAGGSSALAARRRAARGRPDRRAPSRPAVRPGPRAGTGGPAPSGAGASSADRTPAARRRRPRPRRSATGRAAGRPGAPAAPPFHPTAVRCRPTPRRADGTAPAAPASPATCSCVRYRRSVVGSRGRSTPAAGLRKIRRSFTAASSIAVKT